MGKIIEFDSCRQSTRYRDAVHDLDALLEGFTQELTGMALNIAAAGVWRQWDVTQPEGSTLHLDPGDLRRTDDALLGRIMDLCDRIDELRGQAGAACGEERER